MNGLLDVVVHRVALDEVPLRVQLHVPAVDAEFGKKRGGMVVALHSNIVMASAARSCRRRRVRQKKGGKQLWPYIAIQLWPQLHVPAVQKKNHGICSYGPT